MDINYIIQQELQIRGTEPKALDEILGNYTIFPAPSEEGKPQLALKSFYSWMYMIRQYGDHVDYIMKADPDTYMLMDNYLRYLSEYYSPDNHAYIGRVFKSNGNSREPFVTGLSTTLSKTTAELLLYTKE